MKRKTEFSSLDKKSSSVVKYNDLINSIQNSQYNLSLQEQKIVLYLISKIEPDDDDFKLYEFDIKDFCKVCSIDEKSGKNYSKLKTTVMGLINKSFWIMINGKYISMNWIEKAQITPKSGTIEIRLDKDMKPYLLQLKKNLTNNNLYFIGNEKQTQN